MLRWCSLLLLLLLTSDMKFLERIGCCWDVFNGCSLLMRETSSRGGLLDYLNVLLPSCGVWPNDKLVVLLGYLLILMHMSDGVVLLLLLVHANVLVSSSVVVAHSLVGSGILVLIHNILTESCSGSSALSLSCPSEKLSRHLLLIVLGQNYAGLHSWLDKPTTLLRGFGLLHLVVCVYHLLVVRGVFI